MYSIAYFVDTVSEMSTKVDHALTHISITVETVSGMSTGGRSAMGEKTSSS